MAPRSALRAAYRMMTGAAALAALPFRARDGRLAVYYGGARQGDLGGPLVKVAHLARRFPEHRFGYSLAYLLSNAIYLPRPVISTIRDAGVPVVLNQNGVFYPAWYPHGWEEESARMAHLHAQATYVFYQSEFCRFCAEKFLGPRSGPSEIRYNAVDVGRFMPAAEPGGARPFTFLLTGRISGATAYRLLSSIEGLGAARKNGLDVVLKIAGGIAPAVEAEARALSDRLGVADAVVFGGAYTQSKAPAIYRAADAYLTTKHNDPCPNVVLEALASGLPVLYSASGGVPELVGREAGVGLAVPQTFEGNPVPSAAAIAAGMDAVVRGRDAMARAARIRAVECFSLADWLDRHEQLFRKLIGTA